MADEDKASLAFTATTTCPASAVHGDVLAKIFSFLPWRQVLTCRAVCRVWLKAVASTPVVNLQVRTAELAHELPALAHCLPALRGLRLEHGAAELTDDDLSAVTRFTHLQRLDCRENRHLVTWFTQTIHLLPHLVYLNLHNNTALQWELADLAAYLPHLTDLRCINNYCCTGNLRDLLPLGHNLQVVDVSGCRRVTGNLMDLAHLPHLRWMGLSRTAVQGDVRDIQPGHFPTLQLTGLNDAMYGAREFDHVAHAPAILQARHILVKQSTADIPIFPFQLHLSDTSPDYHQRIEQRLYTSARDPPFGIEHVTAGVRRGWRWSNYLGGCCNIQWLDPEPSMGTMAYETYLTELAAILEESRASLFWGFDNPPTPKEYEVLCREKL